MVAPRAEHRLEAGHDDVRVERAPVQRAGRLVRLGRVVDEQVADEQGQRVDADVQGEHAGEPEPHVQVAGHQRPEGGGQRQYGGREPDAHGAVGLVGHVGQVREHADEEAVERAGGGHDDGLRDAGDGGRRAPAHGEQYVERVAQQLPEHRHEHQRPAPAPVVVAPRAREQHEHQRHDLLDDVLPHVDRRHAVLRALLVQTVRRHQQVRRRGGVRVTALVQQQVRAHRGRQHGAEEVQEQHGLHRHRGPDGRERLEFRRVHHHGDERRRHRRRITPAPP